MFKQQKLQEVNILKKLKARMRVIHTSSSSLFISSSVEMLCVPLRELIRLDFPTPLGPTITVVCPFKMSSRAANPDFLSTLQNNGL